MLDTDTADDEERGIPRIPSIPGVGGSGPAAAPSDTGSDPASTTLLEEQGGKEDEMAEEVRRLFAQDAAVGDDAETR
ncbi:MAG: hypothetical protein CYG60_00880 [Actinobacteria bacterium]|nr:MAG: hypothetical protein CYG60_00880 [Actinomycetota bacterium]